MRRLYMLLSLLLLLCTACAPLPRQAAAPQATVVSNLDQAASPTATSLSPTITPIATQTAAPATFTPSLAAPWRDPTKPPSPTPIIYTAGTFAGTITARIEPAPPLTFVSSAAFIDRTHGWVADGASVLFSADGGASRQPRYTAPLPINQLDFVLATRGWMIMQGQSGMADTLYATVDGGVSWQPVQTGASGIYHVDFVDPQHGWIIHRLDNNAPSLQAAIKRTVDGGTSWTSVVHPCAARFAPVKASFINPATGWLLCMVFDQTKTYPKQVYRTDDGGQTWQSVASSTNSNPPDPNGLSASAAASDLFFLDEAHGWFSSFQIMSLLGGVQTSRDGGLTWQGSESAHWPLTGDMRKLRFLTPQQGYAIYRSPHTALPLLIWTDDGGTNWRQLYPALKPAGQIDYVSAQLAFGSGSPLNPLAVLVSTDGARTWSQVGSLQGEPIVPGYIDFVDAKHGWLLAAPNADLSSHTRYLYRTTDGGATWQRLPPITGDIKNTIVQITFVNAQTGYISSGWGHLFRTDDGGLTFRKVSDKDAQPGQFKFISPERGWKTDDFKLYTTGDGGQTWSPLLTTFAQRVISFDLLPDGQHAWVVNGVCWQNPCLLLGTSDGGKTWFRYDLGTANPSYVRFVDEQHGYLRLDRGELYSTADGGRTWQVIP